MKLKRLLTGSAGVACTVLACTVLAACGTATAGTGASPPARVLASHGLTPQQQAKADAAALLASFVPPPGATRLSSAPTGSGGILKRKALFVGVADQLDDVSFWRVPASAASVLAFEQARLPRTFTLGQWGSVGDTHAAAPTPAQPRPAPHAIGNTYGAWWDTWSAPGVADVIALRNLTVEVTDPSSSVTYVRIDANVSWIPARPAAEKVPAGVKVVTITASPDMDHPKGTPAPVTVTSPAKVAQIVALLDGLSLEPPGSFNCLAEEGKGITLSFRAKPNGPVLAAAGEPIPSCAGLGFVIGSVRQSSLAGGGTFIAKVLAIAGAHWPSWYL